MRKNYLQTMLAAGMVVLGLITNFPVGAGPLIYSSVRNLAIQQVPSSPADKIGPDLTALASEYASFLRNKNGRTIFSPSNGLLQVRSGYVVIEAVAETDANALAADLNALGMQNSSVFGRMVSGLMPISALTKAGALGSMRFAQPAYKPMTNVGFTESQGDSAQRSNLARQKFGVRGRGVTIGVLSDSYNNLVGARAGILSGDLPGRGNPNGDTATIRVLSDLAGGGIDEGRAMLEIIHDVAPGATLSFHTAFNGQADFANGIIRLRQAGADIITDDVYYFAAPFFQDGIIAQAVDSVKADGATYFSSAGNSARNSYESTFNPSDTTYFSGEAHNFGDDDQLQRIFIPRGQTLTGSFQWDDPYFSVSGGSGARTDMNIFIYDRTGRRALAGGISRNIGADPVEIINFVNNTTDTLFNIVIEKVAGPSPQKMKYILFGGFREVQEYTTNSPTSFGHPNAAGAIAVGAVRYDRTPAYGRPVPLVESFSSAGGIPILFDKAGNRIDPIVRQKPEISAPQGVNTTFFNPSASPGADYERDGFPNFFGTSASAPHAAAVAALMLEAAEEALNPDTVLARLQRSAIDMDDPITPGFDAGFDFRTGYGFIQADIAVEQSVKPKPTIASFTLVNTDDGTDILTITDSLTIDLSTLSTQNLNIRANIGTAPVGSIMFSLNGIQAIENFPPYAFAGDNGPGEYKTINPPLLPGVYLLTATPYTAERGEGEKGKGLSVTFTLTNGAAVAGGAPQLQTFPNPVTDKSTVAFTLTKPGHTKVEVYDLRGNLVYRLHNQVTEALKQYRYELNSTKLQGGIYLVKLTSGSEVVHQRIYVSR